MIPNQFPSLNFNLGETADMIRDTVASFTADRIAPRADAIDRDNTFTRALWPELGDLGMVGMPGAEDYDGRRQGYPAHVGCMD